MKVLKCYDFPELVMHIKQCPRYAGGVCHPEATPVPPYNEDQANAVVDYQSFLQNGILGILVKPSGTTGQLRGRES